MTNETQQAQFRFIGARHLSLSPLNVRKTATNSGIEQLADLIVAEGVLQNLNVYESPQGTGKTKTTHAVVAGGRRWRALQLLIKQKRIVPNYAVPCLVVSHERAVQISLAENSGRESMIGYVANLSCISTDFYSSSMRESQRLGGRLSTINA